MDMQGPMVSVVYGCLREHALKQHTPFYSDVSPLIGLEPHCPRFWAILGEVSRQSHAENGTLLSSIVINIREKVPGNDFYPIARELGREFANTKIAREAMWVEETRKVFEADWGHLP